MCLNYKIQRISVHLEKATLDFYYFSFSLQYQVLLSYLRVLKNSEALMHVWFQIVPGHLDHYP